MTNQRNRILFRALLHIPVPWVYVLAYLIGLIPQMLIPIKIHSLKVALIIMVSGIVLFAIGALFAAWSLIIFRKARTTTTPGVSSKKVVQHGPYRISRNPMYVSLVLAYLGEAGFLGQIWPVLVLPFLLFYINNIVIPLEEETLEKDFQQEYRDYRSRVSRWI
jgi:protein-S-isoprenylcysteine O-methyltransferase Ste14